MRRMISGKKAALLNKQVIDSNGVIVDENDREFNGDVNFTGTVTGLGKTTIYEHYINLVDPDLEDYGGEIFFSIYSTKPDKITKNSYDAIWYAVGANAEGWQMAMINNGLIMLFPSFSFDGVISYELSTLYQHQDITIDDQVVVLGQ